MRGKAIDGTKLILKKNLLFPVKIAKDQIEELKRLVEGNGFPQIIADSIFVMSFSIIESMLKNTLMYYLSYCPEKLPKNEVSISKQRLTETDDFNFLRKIIGQEISLLRFGPLADMYFKVLGLKMPHGDVLTRLKNSKRLRNAIIHQRTSIDFKAKIAESLENRNVLNCLTDLVEFLENIKGEIEARYKENTKINVLKYLWKQEFWPDFEIFWYIDQENDLIAGFRNPDIEKVLSPSEQFFLGVWRSQLTTYKVDFLNMSSLDSFSQSYLHLFLRVFNLSLIHI